MPIKQRRVRGKGWRSNLGVAAFGGGVGRGRRVWRRMWVTEKPKGGTWQDCQRGWTERHSWGGDAEPKWDKFNKQLTNFKAHRGKKRGLKTTAWG